MRVHTTLIAAVPAAVAVLATVGAAAADGNDDASGTITQTADSGPGPDQGASPLR